MTASRSRAAVSVLGGGPVLRTCSETGAELSVFGNLSVSFKMTRYPSAWSGGCFRYLLHFLSNSFSKFIFQFSSWDKGSREQRRQGLTWVHRTPEPVLGTHIHKEAQKYISKLNGNTFMGVKVSVRGPGSGLFPLAVPAPRWASGWAWQVLCKQWRNVPHLFIVRES